MCFTNIPAIVVTDAVVGGVAVVAEGPVVGGMPVVEPTTKYI